MATLSYNCGCSVTSSMFGRYEIIDVYHCQEHWYLRKAFKSLNRMAREIRSICLNN